MAELAAVLKKQYAREDIAALFMFTDGGPDHNCKHITVQAALLALFLLNGMDTKVVLRTAPQQSWTNPAERIMSVLNLGLQGCSLALTEMDKEFETTMRKCNGMSAIRRTAHKSQLVAEQVGLERQSQGQVVPSAQEEIEQRTANSPVNNISMASMPITLSDQADVDKGMSVVHPFLDIRQEVSVELSSRPSFEEASPPPITSLNS
jgi:hypothetical protein